MASTGDTRRTISSKHAQWPLFMISDALFDIVTREVVWGRVCGPLCARQIDEESEISKSAVEHIYQIKGGRSLV